MGRKSSLTDKQWEEIERRLLDGETGRALAREFKVSEAAIRKRLGARTKKVKDVANQLVAAETAFKSLPIGAQIGARTLADRLLSITEHLCGAAEQSAASSHRLAILANQQLQQVDDVDPMEKTGKQLKAAAALQLMSNDASELPIGLVRANKDLMENNQGQIGSITIDVKRARKEGA